MKWALLLLFAGACHAANSLPGGASPPADMRSGEIAPTDLSRARDLTVPHDLVDPGDGKGCGPNEWIVIPCCGGPAPLPDAAPCVPDPPYCVNPSGPIPPDCYRITGTNQFRCLCA